MKEKIISRELASGKLASEVFFYGFGSSLIGFTIWTLWGNGIPWSTKIHNIEASELD